MGPEGTISYHVNIISGTYHRDIGETAITSQHFQIYYQPTREQLSTTETSAEQSIFPFGRHAIIESHVNNIMTLCR